MTPTNPTKDIGAPAVYVLDAGAGTFTAQAFATGVLSSFGHNPTFAIRRFTGEATFASEAPENASVRVVVQSGSLELTDQVSDKDRREIEGTMRSEVLDVSRFPEIVFEASNPAFAKAGGHEFSASISGKLTLHGATQPQQITARVSVTGNELHANGEFIVHQSSYGIKRVSVAAGALKIKDDVKVTFDIVARKKE